MNIDATNEEDNQKVTELTLPSSTWNRIAHSPKLWGQFTSLKKLDLGNSSLKTLPSCLDALPTLEILFLSENKFEVIPECIRKISTLKMLSLRGNNLTELSSTNLPTKSLVWLILTNNNITKIDPNVGELKLLRKLMLSHNNISHVPKEMGQCKQLELVRLANNEINVALPKEFLTLPKLAWISLAGNPIAHCPQTKEKEILKSTVSVDESKVLGRGASGTVYLGKHNNKDVAVKIFKQESMGSDGRAEDEAAINALVDHPLAVTAHGIFLSEDSETHEGMVMELLEGAEALGKVPSFSTVTRDAGPSDSGKDLSKEQVLSVVWNIANALEHVHSDAQVVNGDVYLHNILQCGKGMAKISDWGASFVYDGDSDNAATSIFEQIEVLAFGRLVQDLFDWHLDIAVPDSTEPDDFLGRSRGKPLEKGLFYDLMSSILHPQQTNRPSFKTIKAALSSMPEFEAAKLLTAEKLG